MIRLQLMADETLCSAYDFAGSFFRLLQHFVEQDARLLARINRSHPNDTPPSPIVPASDGGLTSNKVFSHHGPSRTFASPSHSWFPPSLDVSCSFHNAVWFIFCLPVPANCSLAPVEWQRVILHSETASALRSERWTAHDRDVRVDDGAVPVVPADPSQ